MINAAPVNSAPINGLAATPVGALIDAVGDAGASIAVSEFVRGPIVRGKMYGQLLAGVNKSVAMLVKQASLSGVGDAGAVTGAGVLSTFQYIDATLSAEPVKLQASMNYLRYMAGAGDAFAAKVDADFTLMNSSTGWHFVSGFGLAEPGASFTSFQVSKSLSGSNLVAYPTMNYGPLGWIMSIYTPEPDYRTVTVRNDASTTRMRTFRRQPLELLPYDIDFTEWLAPLLTDAFESAQVTVTGAIGGDVSDITVEDVILLSEDQAGTTIPVARIKVWLSGGVDGATYKITARCDTDGGRRKEVDFRLKIVEV